MIGGATSEVPSPLTEFVALPSLPRTPCGAQAVDPALRQSSNAVTQHWAIAPFCRIDVIPTFSLTRLISVTHWYQWWTDAETRLQQGRCSVPRLLARVVGRAK